MIVLVVQQDQEGGEEGVDEVWSVDHHHLLLEEADQFEVLQEMAWKDSPLEEIGTEEIMLEVEVGRWIE